MEQVSYKRKRKPGLLAALLCLAMVWEFCCGGERIVCEAKEAVTEQEVIDFVTAYYKAQNPEEIDTLADYMEDPESQDFQQYLSVLQTAFAHGLTEQKNIRVAAYPLSDGEHWMVPVSSEMVIQDFDVTFPGLRAWLVGGKQADALKIVSYDNELDEALLREIQEISLSDEMVDWNAEIATQYNDVIAENPDALEWFLEVSEEAGQAKAEVSQAINGQKDANGDEPDQQEVFYVVKKGDCLWRIAEKELGDGMRWSEIYERNREVIGEDPNLIFVGTKLQL